MALPPDTQHEFRPGNKKKELVFEPLSEGLGFHPFSDGLPYAPVSKAPTAAAKPAQQLSQGTGAVAAGLPGYAPPPPAAAPRLPTPRAQAPRVQAPRVPSPAPAPAPFSHPQLRKPQPKPEALAAQLTPELLEPSFGVGYVVRRVLAYLVDSAFNLGLCAGALSLALWKQDLSPDLLLSPGIVLIAGLFLGFFNWAITTAEEVAFGTSVGKRLFGLAVQGTASAIFLRAFFFLPSICFGGIGLLWALFDRRRRCWHDLAVDSQPIEITHL